MNMATETGDLKPRDESRSRSSTGHFDGLVTDISCSEVRVLK